MNSPIDLSFLRARAAQKRIAAIAIIFAILGGVYAYLAPKWYRSVLTVVPVKAQRGGALSSLLGGETSGLSGFLDGGGPSADANRIAAVLQSVAVSDAVIEKFDLRARYDQAYQENTREELWRHCSVKALAKPQLVELSCEDRDPRFVQQLLSFFAEFGNQTFRRVSVSSATEEVRFLEKRVADLRRLADEAAARMRDFQETHRIVDLETQAKAVVSAMAELNARRLGKQLELDYARTFSAHDEPSLKQLRSELSVMSERFAKLEAAETPSQGAEGAPVPGKGGKSVFPPALEVPKLRAEFEKLFRDRRVAEAMLVFALERLESARASEAREFSTFIVLDAPTLPTRKSRPSRMGIVAVVTGLGIAIALALEAWRAGALVAVLRRRPVSVPAPVTHVHTS